MLKNPYLINKKNNKKIAHMTIIVYFNNNKNINICLFNLIIILKKPLMIIIHNLLNNNLNNSNKFLNKFKNKPK